MLTHSQVLSVCWMNEWKRRGHCPLDRNHMSRSPYGKCPRCCCLVAKSCPTLCDPMDCNPPGSSVHGIAQARILECVAISFSRGSSRPRNWTHISCIGRRILYPLNHQGSLSLHNRPFEERQGGGRKENRSGNKLLPLILLSFHGFWEQRANKLPNCPALLFIAPSFLPDLNLHPSISSHRQEEVIQTTGVLPTYV